MKKLVYLCVFLKSPKYESAIRCAARCCISSVDCKKLNKLIVKTASVLGTALERLEVVMERRMLHRLRHVMDNTAHTPPYTSSAAMSTGT